jgi:hypothetical protein
MVFVGLLVIQQRVAGVDTPQPSAAEKGSLSAPARLPATTAKFHRKIV